MLTKDNLRPCPHMWALLSKTSFLQGKPVACISTPVQMMLVGQSGSIWQHGSQNMQEENCIVYCYSLRLAAWIMNSLKLYFLGYMAMWPTCLGKSQPPLSPMISFYKCLVHGMLFVSRYLCLAEAHFTVFVLTVCKKWGFFSVSRLTDCSYIEQWQYNVISCTKLMRTRYKQVAQSKHPDRCIALKYKEWCQNILTD